MYLIVVIKTNFILIYHKVRNIYNKIQVLTWGKDVPQLSCPKVEEGDSSKLLLTLGRRKTGRAHSLEALQDSRRPESTTAQAQLSP